MNKKPNIIFIITDQQRYDSLGCTGNPHAVTPHLDALAAESTLCTRFITNSAICSPSRASIFTGLQASTHGVWTNGIALPRAEYTPVTESSQNAFPGKWVAPTIRTFADHFKEAGYRTISVGKLHFTPYFSHPDLALEESELYWKMNPEKMAAWDGPYYGFEDVTLSQSHGELIYGGHYGAWLRKNHPEVVEAVIESRKTRTLEFPEHPNLYPSEIPEELHNTTWLGDRACEKIREAKELEKPVMMWVGFPDPHSPYVPPKALAEEFATHDVLPSAVPYACCDDKPEAFQNLMRKRNAHLERPEWNKRIRQYTDALNTMIDKSVGRIVDTLKELGEWDNTILVFTSDHGDFLGDYGMDGKCVPACNSLNHVPFILHAPGQNLPEQIDGAISGVDLFPTLCDLAEIEQPEDLHGESILQVESSGRQHPVMVQHFTPKRERTNLSVYDDRFRYTFYTATDERELYDHTADPTELANLAADPAYAEEMERLHRALTDELTRTTLPRAGRVAVW